MDTHPSTASQDTGVVPGTTPASLRARVSQLEAQIAAERAENARRLREVEPRLVEFRSTLQALHQKLMRGTQDREAAEARLATQDGEIASLHAELASAREASAAQEARIQELEKKLALARDRVAQMRDELISERRGSKRESPTVGADPRDVPPPPKPPAPRTTEEGFPDVPGLASEGVAERSSLGTRFRARRAQDRRPVHVIVLARVLNESDRRRVEALIDSRHPNLASALATGTSECGPYLVLERTLGDTLDEWVARDGLPTERTALAVALQIARGLRHAAFHGTLHGDLTPKSVRVAPDGHVQVEDAGLADLRLSPAAPSADPRFASPERIRTGVAPDARSDIYSLGAILHLLLTGKPPFEGDAAAVADAQAKGPAPDPRALRASVSREASAFVAKLMTRDADLRPVTWDQVLVDLERLADEEPELGPPDSFRGRVARFVALHPIAACAVASAPLVAAAVWLRFAAIR